MSGMFARIRWHLVGWNMLVVGVILTVLGGTLYIATARNLLDQTDRDLTSRAELAAGNLMAALGGDPTASRAGYQGGVFYLVVAVDGRILANPQNVDVALLERPQPLATPGSYATARLDNEPVRLVSAAMRPPSRRGPPGSDVAKHPDVDEPRKPELSARAKPGGLAPVSPRELDGAVLVAGKSLAPEEAALRSFLLVLIGGEAAGLVLALAGAWFLAGRSMVPIERAFQRQQEFVADASHELRTPLTVLRSATDLMFQDVDQPLRDNADLVDVVRDEIGRLQRLTGDLLTLARSDRGQLVLALAPLNTRVMAADVARRLEPLARERGVELSVTAADPPPTVEADPDRLRQVLVILLDNALKHTPAGGRVSVDVRRDERHVAFDIADTGPGIAPEHLSRLFERFYRADPARTQREESGTGLGLAIAKSLIDAHGGELIVATAPGAGTRMTVRLPTTPDVPSLAERLRQIARRVAHRPAG